MEKNFNVEMLHFPFVTKITTFNITKYININPKPHHKFLAMPLIVSYMKYSCIALLMYWERRI